MSTFGARLTRRVHEVGSPTCVGLDPHLDRLPGLVAGSGRAAAAGVARSFCFDAIDAVADTVAAVKPQVAFFEALGAAGVAALEDVVAHARSAGLLVVLDAKRGDIGSTARAYAQATLDDDGPLGCDAVTLSPYLGAESLAPFMERTAVGKGLFVLVRTSNPGAGAWQLSGDAPFAHAVADWVRAANEAAPGAVGAVVGATLAAAEVEGLRMRMPHAWFLVPGYGAQGAGAAQIRPHLRADGGGALVVSARGVLYPPSGVDADPPQAIATRARDFARDVASLGT